MVLGLHINLRKLFLVAYTKPKLGKLLGLDLLHKLFLHPEIPGTMTANENIQRWYFLLAIPDVTRKYGCSLSPDRLLADVVCHVTFEVHGLWSGWMNQQPLSRLLHALLERLLERDQPSRSVHEAVYLSRTVPSDVLTFNRRSVAGMSAVYLLMFLCGVSTVTNEDFNFRLQFLWCEIKRKKENGRRFAVVSSLN